MIRYGLSSGLVASELWKMVSPKTKSPFSIGYLNIKPKYSSLSLESLTALVTSHSYHVLANVGVFLSSSVSSWSPSLP
jgi:hypothetical protein